MYTQSTCYGGERVVVCCPGRGVGVGRDSSRRGRKGGVAASWLGKHLKCSHTHTGPRGLGRAPNTRLSRILGEIQFPRCIGSRRADLKGKRFKYKTLVPQIVRSDLVKQSRGRVWSGRCVLVVTLRLSSREWDWSTFCLGGQLGPRPQEQPAGANIQAPSAALNLVGRHDNKTCPTGADTSCFFFVAPSNAPVLANIGALQ